MAHRGARRGAGQGGPAGIGKKIQHPDGPPGFLDLLPEEIPVDRLLREQPGVLKAGWADLEFQIPVADGPELGVAAVDLPAAAARRGAVIPGIGLLPFRALFRPPNDLRVRPDEDGITPPLQLFSAAGIQDLKVLPLVCDAHGFSHFLSLVVSFRLRRGWT